MVCVNDLVSLVFDQKQFVSFLLNLTDIVSPTITLRRFLSTSLKLSSSWLVVRARVLWISGEWQQLFMGVSSCTGPIGEVGVLDYNAGLGVECSKELTESSSTFAVIYYIHKSVSLQRHLHWKNANIQLQNSLYCYPLRLVGEREQEQEVIEQMRSWCSWNDRPPSNVKNAHDYGFWHCLVE